MAELPAILEVQDLARHFPVRNGIGRRSGAVLRAVDGVSFSLRRGETLAVVGESGSGKTTLARLLVRLLEPTAGRILFDGTDITMLGPGAMRPIRRRVQMIFQDPYSSLDPRMTVSRLLSEPLKIHGMAPNHRDERVRELLAVVGLKADHADRYPHEFSGGQRQRIGIARALAVEPELIVGDEPVSALDVSVRAQILNLIDGIRASMGLTMVMITHDLGVVRHMADRVLVLYLGRIAEIGDADRIFRRPRHPYTSALLAATLDPFRPKGERPDALRGEAPSPISPPPGCAFHPRCPMAQAICRTDPPKLRDGGGGHLAACHFADEVAPALSEAPLPPRPYEGRLEVLRRQQPVLREG